jgi:hypothetical protein
MLLDMGFEKERAEIAVKKTGGSMPFPPIHITSNTNTFTVQGALEWLEANQDKSLEEITNPETDASIEPPALEEGEVAKSMKCNDCGKKFRSMAQAEFHAEKTYVI